jgi:hypothetical protein
MARHRKIDVRMWGDAKFLRLSAPKPNGQTLWVYLLTGPHTTSIPGLFTVGEASLAESLNWPMKGFRKAFREAFREGMVEADFSARVVWIPKSILYNLPESPNVVKSWRAYWDEIPECKLKEKAYLALYQALKDLGEAFAKAFAEGCKKPTKTVDNTPSLNQEQEQEQEQEKKSASPRPRDELFDAVCQLAGADAKVNGSHIGKVCAALRAADPPYTPEEVRKLPEAIRARGRPFTLTIGAIEKFIGWVRAPNNVVPTGPRPATPEEFANWRAE